MYATSPGAAGAAESIPTEFLYWQNKDSRSARRLRRLLKLMFRVDPVLPDEVVQQYARSYYDADPVAEAFVEEVYKTQGQAAGRAMLDAALAHGVDAVANAPESLKRLFAEMEQTPAWVDHDLVELGARVFRRYGTHMYFQAGAITLEGYRENSVAKPLAFTGAYSGATANRRFLETARFWIDVSEPGGLNPGGEGRATALKVRIMHVFVRAQIVKHPQWDHEAWGVPISQGDALLTLMGGSFIPGYLLKFIGYRTSRHEIEAMMHFWRYVGHLMGVQPRWYPSNVDEALGLMYTSVVKGANGAGEDAINLAQSYVASYKPVEGDSLRDRLAKALEYRLQLGYTSIWVPPMSRRQLKLPSPGIWVLAPFLQFPFIFALETLRRRMPKLDDFRDRQARRATKAWLGKRLGERTAEYKAVESFTR